MVEKIGLSIWMNDVLLIIVPNIFRDFFYRLMNLTKHRILVIIFFAFFNDLN
jgi:hypothetical protein